MTGFTISRAAAACGARLSADFGGGAVLGRAVIDSRQVQPGDLFVAYRGERADGHDYIGAAFDRGAACCLAERLPEGETRPVLLVDDVQRALEQLAAAYRDTLTLPIVGVTGSVGKTSAKEMIAAVLSRRFRTLKTEGNLNNQIGVPMTLSRIEPEHEAAVVEMGISGFGEMTALARIVRPKIAVFTVIGHAHLEFLGDLEGVFRAKTELLPFVAEDGAVVVNGDDSYPKTLRCLQRLLTVGLGENCDMRAVDLHTVGANGTACTLVYGERRIPVTIPAFGRHMVYAALEGAAVGLLLGLTDEEIAAGIAAFAPVGRRAAVTDTGFVTLVDDCYNSNPDSLRCGLDSLAALPGRHVAILGDMLEMGENAWALHVELGRYARETGAALVLACGELGRGFAEGAGETGRWFESSEALLSALPELLRQGDAVLVKASRAMRFEEISEGIKTLWSD